MDPGGPLTGVLVHPRGGTGSGPHRPLRRPRSSGPELASRAPLKGGGPRQPPPACSLTAVGQRRPRPAPPCASPGQATGPSRVCHLSRDLRVTQQATLPQDQQGPCGVRESSTRPLCCPASSPESAREPVLDRPEPTSRGVVRCWGLAQEAGPSPETLAAVSAGSGLVSGPPGRRTQEGLLPSRLRRPAQLSRPCPRTPSSEHRRAASLRRDVGRVAALCQRLTAVGRGAGPALPGGPDGTGSPQPAHSDRRHLCVLRGSSSVSSFAERPDAAAIQKR